MRYNIVRRYRSYHCLTQDNLVLRVESVIPGNDLLRIVVSHRSRVCQVSDTGMYHTLRQDNLVCKVESVCDIDMLWDPIVLYIVSLTCIIPEAGQSCPQGGGAPAETCKTP